MIPVDKEFCDERSGNILISTKELKDDIQQVKKAVDRMTWMVFTTLISVCGGLWANLTAQGLKCIAATKAVLISFFV